MNKFLTLTRVLFKNGAMSGRTEDRKHNVATLIVIIAFLPLLVLEAVMLWKTYDVFAPMGLTEAVLGGLFTAACVVMVLLGILYVISTYYFADDVTQLLTMPIPPHQILAAKFCVVMLFQYVLELLIVLPGLVVIGVRGGNFFYWINAVLIFAALPLIPTVVCSVISILLMAFGKFFRNKDRVKFLAGLLAIVLAMGLSIAMQFAGGRPSSAQALLNNSDMIKQAVVLFPSNIAAVKAVLGGNAVSFLWLVLFLLLSAAAFAIFLLLGSRLYLSGAVGLTQSTAHKKDAAESVHTNKQRPAVLAIALKDWRMLCRTPAYSLNCLLSALLVPLILVVTFAATLKGVTIPHANALAIALSVLFLNFTSMMNMVSPTAVSRDGRDSAVTRFIPVPFRAQIFGKLIPGLALSFAAMLITAVPVGILLKPDALTVAAVCGICAISLITFNMFGLFIDVVFPKLDWDDETIAVKRNSNVAIEMIAIFAALALPAFLVYKLQMDLRGGIIFLLVYNLALLALAAWLLFWKGPAFYGAGLGSKQTEKSRDPGKTVQRVAGTIFAIAILGLMGWEFFFVRTDVKITASEVTVSAGLGESSSFELSQIKSVYLKDTLPPASGKNGFAVGSQLRGSFVVGDLGRGHVYTQNSKGPFLFVMLKDGGFTVFNFDDSSKTYSLYGTFKKYAAQP